MKYIAPDYELVQLQVASAFASYNSGCSELENLVWDYTSPCKGTDDYQQVVQTMTQIGLGSLCWSGNVS